MYAVGGTWIVFHMEKRKGRWLVVVVVCGDGHVVDVVVDVAVEIDVVDIVVT